VEISNPLFQDITSSELASFQVITNNAAIIIWVTGGGLFKSKRPEFNLVRGVARAVMTEQPSTKIFLLDIDSTTSDTEICIDQILWIAVEAIHNPKPQFEYLSHEGLLYTSQILGDKALNRLFHNRHHSASVKTRLKDAGYSELAIATPGHTDTLFFNGFDSLKGLERDSVEVETKCFGLNAKVSDKASPEETQLMEDRIFSFSVERLTRKMPYAPMSLRAS
jgi:hypothetical protein